MGRTAYRVQSLTTAPVSKDSPLDTIDILRGQRPCGSHGVAHLASIMGEGRACHCIGQSQSCRQLGSGWENPAPQRREEMPPGGEVHRQAGTEPAQQRKPGPCRPKWGSENNKEQLIQVNTCIQSTCAREERRD
ncbi:hypothetical protein AMECASPLE_023207 [Ameca splendens]|uniref:Uncharacterized protein n=1 Tax=Ameca splendens TaxID=208324 RepID=A0ABV0YFF4_9TELE